MAARTIHPPIKAGDRFGRLTVQAEAPRRRMPNGEPKKMWLCRCDCGERTEAFDQALKRGTARHCGCERRVYPQTLVGARYGRLTIERELSVEERPSPARRAWECRCDCSAIVSVAGVDLRTGHTRSCGCLVADMLGSLRTTHGATRDKKKRQPPEYVVWQRMRGRCLNPANRNYADYGGRGITICDRWRFGEDGRSGFECFLADMGPRPSPAHTIERVRNNEEYSPGNCVWATRLTQAGNRRGNHYVLFRGEAVCLSVAARRAGLNPATVRDRRNRGWPEARWFEPLRT